MTFLVRGGHLSRFAVALGISLWAAPGSQCQAGGGEPTAAAICPTCHKPHAGVHAGHVGAQAFPKGLHRPYKPNHKHPGPGYGTLGYGPPGQYAGFQGFGLGYHLGYGYGGYGLGPGADGGYPFYGGPGYPHPWPQLKRFHPIVPFPFFGGPGGPVPGHPNYFGTVGALATDEPVIQIEREPGEADYNSGYGMYTGVLPYPETAFAPFTTAAGAGGSASGVSTESAPNAPPNPNPAPGELLDEHAGTRSLGVDAEALHEPGGPRGLKVTRVYPGSAAAQGGLAQGDVILSINGYRTELPSHLAWVIANGAPDRVLNLKVVGVSDGTEKDVTVRLP